LHLKPVHRLLCSMWWSPHRFFFSRILAKLMWGWAREFLWCHWNPSFLDVFFALLQEVLGYRRLIWFCFAEQCWDFLLIRNKLTIKLIIPHKSSACLFESASLCSFGCHCWRWGTWFL
jgi:hypothetical protein